MIHTFLIAVMIQFFFTRCDATEKILCFSLPEHLFTGKWKTLNISRLQIIRNSSSLFLEHSKSINLLWNGFASSFLCWSSLFLRLAHIFIVQRFHFSAFEDFWASFTWPAVNTKITVCEATEPIMTRCFTYSSIFLNFLEFSMCSSGCILRKNVENQHFQQVTNIWHKIIHSHATKSIWRTNKITNLSKPFDLGMSKLRSWRFGYVLNDQHLLLKPSF